MIYQIHDDHGKHIAYNYLEKKANEEQGWRTVSREEWLAYKPGHNGIPENGAPEPEIDALRRQYEAAFGKKPHHKLSAEKIRQALDDDSE